MAEPTTAWWDAARRARDRLAAQIIGHPNVNLIDIGLDPEGASATPVLRVHLRSASAVRPAIPSEIDQIPVRIIFGTYRIQGR